MPPRAACRGVQGAAADRPADPRAPADRIQFIITGYKLFVGSHKKAAAQLPAVVWAVDPPTARMWHAKADVMRVMKHLGSIRNADAAWLESIPGWCWKTEKTAKHVKTLRNKYRNNTITPQEYLVAVSMPGWSWA